jgi:hypothetical protein
MLTGKSGVDLGFAGIFATATKLYSYSYNQTVVIYGARNEPVASKEELNS